MADPVTEGIDPISIRNTSDTKINPATEEKQEDIVTAIGSISGLVTESYDYIGVTYPTTTSEVYAFKTGGSTGTTVATVTIVYTDDSKTLLSSVTKT